jgi:adenylate cyclase
MRKTPNRRMLERLLDERNEHPERLGEIDRRIRAAFEERHAVFVLDMCGFSRLTVRHGIVHFLAMIRRLHGTVAPLIRAAGGRIVKTEADNVFAVFRDVPDAVAAARAIAVALARANAVLPADWDLHVGIGIGHGDVLMIGADDLYGSELNLASKLGEDVAGAGEVLLTEAAAKRLRPAARARLVRRRARVGGQTVRHWALATPAAGRRA